jgi:putative ABC transport system permease protein
MSMLDRKLWRDLMRMKGQVATIALVVACGIAVFVSAVTAYLSLKTAQSRYYSDTHFADVFARLKRAPQAIVSRIAALPGIAQVETRIVFDIMIDIAAVAEPVSGRIIALPERGTPILNRLYLRQGTMPAPQSENEVLASEAFAAANHLEPGDTLSAILNGKRRILRIVGIVLSPEYVYASPPGDPIPDDKRFAILWMNHRALAAAFDMEGAFNDVSMSLAPGGQETRVKEQLDRILEPYGGTIAYGRYLQASNRFLSDEIEQQGVMASTVPLIFLAVGAFLVNIVMRRLIQTQREQIATLKALGYSDGQVGAHYLKFIAIVTGAGGLLGVILGIAIGRYMMESYQWFFRFPSLAFDFEAWVPIAALSISGIASLIGAMTSLRTILKLQPAEAMRMPAPRAYRRNLLDRLAGKGGISMQNLLIVRAIFGRPLRAALITIGMALSLSLILLSIFWQDALNYMIDAQFGAAERQDAMVTFDESVDSRAIEEIAHFPGVVTTEGYRSVPVLLRSGQDSYRTVITGFPPDAVLRHVVDADLREIPIPPEGLLLSQRLAKRLRVVPGDTIQIEVLERDRPHRALAVAALSNDQVGLSAYMSAPALHRLMREGDLVNAVALTMDRTEAPRVYAELKSVPKVRAVSIKALSLRTFRETTALFVLVLAFIFSAFALTITVGVVYNGARIALQERAWELASLRVLGFTRAQVSWFLFGELALEAVIAIPLGLWLGHTIVAVIVDLHETEMFKIPAVIEPRSYAIAALTVLAGTLLSALIVRRSIDRLDLVGALKARE